MRALYSLPHPGRISDILDDVNESIGWVATNGRKYGGDTNRIFVMGQSAGAHIAATAVVNKATQEATQVR